MISDHSFAANSWTMLFSKNGAKEIQRQKSKVSAVWHIESFLPYLRVLNDRRNVRRRFLLMLCVLQSFFFFLFCFSRFAMFLLKLNDKLHKCQNVGNLTV